MTKTIDLLHGKIMRSLCILAVPIVMTYFIQMAYNFIDMIWIGRLGSGAVAGVGVAGMFTWFSNGLVMMAKMGGQVKIGHCLGAGDDDDARRYLGAALQLGIVFALFFGIGINILAHSLIGFFHLSSPAVIHDAVLYLRITCGLVIFTFMNQIFTSSFNVYGDSRTPFIMNTCGLVSNVIADPLLIFGPGPFPKLGIEGAALATGIGQALTLLVYLAAWRSCTLPVTLSMRKLAWDWRLDLRLYSVGIPATLSLALPSLLISALNSILSAFSPIFVVILGIYYKLQTFLYLPASGIVQGMRPVIGYNYGAGEQGRVREIYRVTLGLGAAIMAAGTVLCLALPTQLMGLFTQNPESIQAGAEALRIISVGFLVSSVSVAAGGALEGLGKGGPSLVISLLRYTLVMIPAAWLLSHLIGPTGVWHAFWLSEAVTALFSILIYRRAVR